MQVVVIVLKCVIFISITCISLAFSRTEKAKIVYDIEIVWQSSIPLHYVCVAFILDQCLVCLWVWQDIHSQATDIHS